MIRSTSIPFILYFTTLPRTLMKHSYLALVIASVLSATVLVGCDNKEDAAAGENAQQQMRSGTIRRSPRSLRSP